MEYTYKVEKINRTWYVLRVYSDGHRQAECGFTTKKVAMEALEVRLQDREK